MTRIGLQRRTVGSATVGHSTVTATKSRLLMGLAILRFRYNAKPLCLLQKFCVKSLTKGVLYH
jgi:hypothetical protein